MTATIVAFGLALALVALFAMVVRRLIRDRSETTFVEVLRTDGGTEHVPISTLRPCAPASAVAPERGRDT